MYVCVHIYIYIHTHISFLNGLISDIYAIQRKYAPILFADH